MPKHVIPIRNRLCKLKKFHLIFVCKCRKNIFGQLNDDITEGSSMQDSLTAVDLPYRTGSFTCRVTKRCLFSIPISRICTALQKAESLISHPLSRWVGFTLRFINIIEIFRKDRFNPFFLFFKILVHISISLLKCHSMSREFPQA
jgi:hypothetical protein